MKRRIPGAETTSDANCKICTRTRRYRERYWQSAACFRCRSWAGFIINKSEFEFSTRTAAAASTSAGVRRSMGMHSRVADRTNVSTCKGKRPGQPLERHSHAWGTCGRPRPKSGLPRNPENRYHARQFGSHPGNTGLNAPGS